MFFWNGSKTPLELLWRLKTWDNNWFLFCEKWKLENVNVKPKIRLWNSIVVIAPTLQILENVASDGCHRLDFYEKRVKQVLKFWKSKGPQFWGSIFCKKIDVFCSRNTILLIRWKHIKTRTKNTWKKTRVPGGWITVQKQRWWHVVVEYGQKLARWVTYLEF